VLNKGGCRNTLYGYIFTVWALCWVGRSPTLWRFIYKVAVANQALTATTSFLYTK